MKKLRTVLVDDEHNNMDLLSYLVKKNCPSIEIVAKCTTFKETEETLKSEDFDLVFLDIRLGNQNSFEILEKIENFSFHIIFTTAYDEYAIRAFRYNAADYLLKPLEIDELKEAVQRVEDQIKSKDFFHKDQIKELSKSILGNQLPKYITISGMDRVDFIHPNDIVYLKSAGRYTEFYLKDKKRKIISSKPIGEYESILEKDHFYRIHNSYLINLNALLNINKRAGNYCELTNGESLPISRRRYEGLVKMMRLK